MLLAQILFRIGSNKFKNKGQNLPYPQATFETLSSIFSFFQELDDWSHAEFNDNIKLQFNPDGKFKIVQFNDTQDDEHIDRRTVELMEKVLDAEKPDFVVLNGDNITGDCTSELEMKQAMNNVAQPMEQRGIKWAITFGNHDEDSTPNGGLDENDMLNFYMSYKYNCNQPGADITGTGNMN